jgi:hypothetical protein
MVEPAGTGESEYVGAFKFFHPRRGWGFLALPETHRLCGNDILFQRRQLPGSLLHVNPGDRLYFSVAHGENGMLAVGRRRTEQDKDLRSNSVRSESFAGVIEPAASSVFAPSPVVSSTAKKWRPVQRAKGAAVLT